MDFLRGRPCGAMPLPSQYLLHSQIAACRSRKRHGIIEKKKVLARAAPATSIRFLMNAREELFI
jgi:hypothetical protein